MLASETPIKYHSTKTYTSIHGFSCTFRQWKAHSHCRFFHGYALGFKFEFESNELDHQNWVVDFGSLKSLKGLLEDTFDHKTIVAEDDPMLHEFQRLDSIGLIQLRVLPSVGCERIAEYVFRAAEIWLNDNGYAPRVRLKRVTVSEHEGNSAYVEAQHVPSDRTA